MLGRIRSRFGRSELRFRPEGCLHGLLSRVERKNAWQLLVSVGYATPHGIQRLLGCPSWFEYLVRDDLRKYLTDHFGNRNGILIMDGTGFLKKGAESIDAHRQ